MRVRGVHYDVGHRFEGDGPGTTRPYFDRSAVKADMAMIAGQLHANTVRVAGTDLSRLEIAAGLALEAGMAVWFSPHPGDLGGASVVDYLADAARIASRLHTSSGDVVMVAGCELSLFCSGFLPGATLDDRLATLTSTPPSIDLPEYFRELPLLLNATLSESVAAIRDCFRGRVTYASAPWEQIDWAQFDLVSVDLYRDSSNAAQYRDILRSYQRFGKPVVVTEFGCCTYRGAADAGALGFDVVYYNTEPPGWRLKVVGLERSEAEQSQYLKELVTVFDEEKIEGAFWHTFAGWAFPYRLDPRADLDLASFGLVKLIENHAADDTNFDVQPKEAFQALSATYQQEARA